MIKTVVPSGAEQLLPRPGDQPGPRERRWILHLQGELRRIVRVQPLGSGGRAERKCVSRCDNSDYGCPVQPL